MTPPNELRPVSFQDGRLRLLDQRCLPGEERWRELDAVGEVAEAIADMMVRGAPAIGCAAGYGLALAARAAPDLPAAFA
jgi:methylthioribose-1-phosphate isomerase